MLIEQFTPILSAPGLQLDLSGNLELRFACLTQVLLQKAQFAMVVRLHVFMHAFTAFMWPVIP